MVVWLIVHERLQHGYDDASRLTGITYRRGGATLGDLNYGLDAAGRRTAIWGSYARTGSVGRDELGDLRQLERPADRRARQHARVERPVRRHDTTGWASDNAFRYSGRENDGTGLQFNRNRYYSPGMGRFISPDPIGLGGGDANLYSYAGNNPISATDPLGLYMEINDHLIVTPGGQHLIKPYAWMAPLANPFPDILPPELVGWDSYRPCVWGKFADRGCTPSDDDDLGDLLDGAWDEAWETSKDFQQWYDSTNRWMRDEPTGRVTRNCGIGGAIGLGIAIRFRAPRPESTAAGCAIYNLLRRGR